jgi:hypothetical protein
LRSWRYFHQVQITLTGESQRVKRLHNSQLFAIGIDDLQFGDTDLSIDAKISNSQVCEK